MQPATRKRKSLELIQSSLTTLEKKKKNVSIIEERVQVKITTYLFIGFLSTLRDEGKSDFSIHTYAKKRKINV